MENKNHWKEHPKIFHKYNNPNNVAGDHTERTGGSRCARLVGQQHLSYFGLFKLPPGTTSLAASTACQSEEEIGKDKKSREREREGSEEVACVTKLPIV